MGGHTGSTGASTGGNVLGFTATFPKPGNYRVFAQFKRGDDAVTVPFDVKVS